MGVQAIAIGLGSQDAVPAIAQRPGLRGGSSCPPPHPHEHVTLLAQRCTGTLWVRRRQTVGHRSGGHARRLQFTTGSDGRNRPVRSHPRVRQGLPATPTRVGGGHYCGICDRRCGSKTGRSIPEGVKAFPPPTWPTEDRALSKRTDRQAMAGFDPKPSNARSQSSLILRQRDGTCFSGEVQRPR